MISTKVFEDINKLTPIEGMTAEANSPAEAELSRGRQQSRGWFKKLFKAKRQVRLTSKWSVSVRYPQEPM